MSRDDHDHEDIDVTQTGERLRTFVCRRCGRVRSEPLTPDTPLEGGGLDDAYEDAVAQFLDTGKVTIGDGALAVTLDYTGNGDAPHDPTEYPYPLHPVLGVLHTDDEDHA